MESTYAIGRGDVFAVSGLPALPWLAAVRPAAPTALAAAAPQSKLHQEKALRPESHGFRATRMSTAHTTRVDVTPVRTARRMADAQTSHNAYPNGGVPGPQYAWREPVIT
ncbi:hypothetical protein [Acrocarpospora catenulata]|uniref:hypothetical protein n=1 Tax=Acrocarpospora catenulata TaxID=2836182 RepID=UPI001BD9FEA0|nr:hypothetical protein [Acrocarpospora catenulata]